MKHTNLSKWPALTLLSALFITLAVVGCKKDNLNPDLMSNAKPVAKKNLGAPTLTCAGNTLYSIDLTFTAGTNGAPSGFSLQWMTKDEFEQYGWPVVSDEVGARTSFCKASFSGNANASRYNLLNAGDVATVTVGSFLLDNGASTNCPQELDPCKDYVFRAFSHGDNLNNKSSFSIDQVCSTECNTIPGCITRGYGYWKQNCNMIPAGGLTLGTIAYTADEVCQILNKVSAGNGLVILAHQYATAALNGSTSLSAASTAVGGLNLLTATQPAAWERNLVSTLRRSNESCSQ